MDLLKTNDNNAGRYKKGKDSAEKILQAATDLLIDSGYHNFSLRKVADAVGIRLGNLQYYFPSKDSLVEALLDRTIQAYVEDFEKLRKQGTPREQFKAIVREVLTDLGTRETTLFFPELWSLSNHEDNIMRLMDGMYAKYRKVLCEVITDLNPRLSPPQVKRLALFISCSMEGHTVFIGHEKPWNAETDNIIEMATQSFLWLIESGEIPHQSLP